MQVVLGQAPADILLRGASVLNVFTGEVLRTNVALVGERIAGVGDYHEGHEVVDLTGRFLIPGLIDAYLHLESSMMTPPAFARAALPHGTTTVIADAQEIVNAIGLIGLEYMLEAGQSLPLDIYYLISRDYPEIYQKNPAVLSKMVTAQEVSKRMDREASFLNEKYFQALAAAGVRTDHECTYPREAEEKLELGVHILIREGSSSKNLDQLLNMVNTTTYPFCSFCSDDRLPQDLIAEGEMDHILRYAVAWGLDPVTAVRMATLNPARLYGLQDRGAIAPGYLADLVVVDSIYAYRVQQVYKRGVKVVDKGKVTVPPIKDKLASSLRASVTRTVHLTGLDDKLNFTPPVGAERARVIDVLGDQLVTRMGWVSVGAIDPEYDVMKVAVIERGGKRGSVGLGFVRGFGLKTGALASTVAHEDHNLIVVGAEKEAMLLAAETVAQMGGGLAVVSANKVLATLPLPVAGLMSEESAEKIALKYAEVNAAAQGLGCTIYAPFMTMSFLTQPSIPALKITEQGLVEVNQNKVVDLWE